MPLSSGQSALLCLPPVIWNRVAPAQNLFEKKGFPASNLLCNEVITYGSLICIKDLWTKSARPGCRERKQWTTLKIKRIAGSLYLPKKRHTLNIQLRS